MWCSGWSLGLIWATGVVVGIWDFYVGYCGVVVSISDSYVGYCGVVVGV